ncbi:thiamine phosphate synthase [Nannocystis sp.]|uniref:thiamine phosphate synthase n=1 Tax=Nannocystis sp. TaxID=1962667 RepID=UPI0025E3B251|nr:thiamine phosphate synthase [Nannocystis sp.]
MTRLPFRLLAITPPTGPVPGDILERWLAAGVASVGLAVLLREPGLNPAALLASDRLAALRRSCRAHAIPQLLSIDPGAPLPPLPPDIAGLHLRGDPDLASLATLRRAAPPPVPRDSSRPPVPRDSSRPHVPRDSSRPPVPRDSSSPPVPRDSSLPPVPRDSCARATGLWLGRSCHGAPQPGHDLVDYTLLAPVFPPSSSPGKTPAGLAALRAWTAVPGATIFALGGVTPATAAACLAAGAHGLAGIGVFFGDPAQVEQDVAALRRSIAALDRHVEPLSPR